MCHLDRLKTYTLIYFRSKCLSMNCLCSCEFRMEHPCIFYIPNHNTIFSPNILLNQSGYTSVKGFDCQKNIKNG